MVQMSADLSLSTSQSFTASYQAATFSALPKESVFEILSLLSLKDLSRISCVSKQWNKFASHDVFWDLRKFSPFIKVIDEREWSTYFHLEDTDLKLNNIVPLRNKA